MSKKWERSCNMAKKFGKFLLGVTAAGAAAAGVYYLLKKKYEDEPEDEFDDDFDDDDFELDDDLGVVSERGYVHLNPSSEPKSEESDSVADESCGNDFDKAVENAVAEADKAVEDIAAETGKAAEDAADAVKEAVSPADGNTDNKSAKTE